MKTSKIKYLFSLVAIFLCMVAKAELYHDYTFLKCVTNQNPPLPGVAMGYGRGANKYLGLKYDAYIRYDKSKPDKSKVTIEAQLSLLEMLPDGKVQKTPYPLRYGDKISEKIIDRIDLVEFFTEVVYPGGFFAKPFEVQMISGMYGESSGYQNNWSMRKVKDILLAPNDFPLNSKDIHKVWPQSPEMVNKEEHSNFYEEENNYSRFAIWKFVDEKVGTDVDFTCMQTAVSVEKYPEMNDLKNVSNVADVRGPSKLKYNYCRFKLNSGERPVAGLISWRIRDGRVEIMRSSENDWSSNGVVSREGSLTGKTYGFVYKDDSGLPGTNFPTIRVSLENNKLKEIKYIGDYRTGKAIYAVTNPICAIGPTEEGN
ncbi:MAG TPA: hypothetical protein VKR58_14415 [Aquella sp.]|nr:hypothetical protein [Aquella sp.]